MLMSHADKIVRMRELYPQMSETQLVEALANLEAYLKLVIEIFEDAKSAEGGNLTTRPENS
jgi:hypothetical protein